MYSVLLVECLILNFLTSIKSNNIIIISIDIISKMKLFDLQQQAKNKNTQQNEYSTGEVVGNYMGLFFKMFFMFALLSINFVALSIALNCNQKSTPMVRYSAAVFAFFFGFIYLIVNYYSYRVMTKKQICEFDKDTLFPF